MTLSALLQQAQAQTHTDEQKILALVREAWPGHERFTPTQCALVVWKIQKDEAA